VKRVLITGSNRGIGLEFTRQYLEAGDRVYATCRRPAEAQALHILAKLHDRLSIHRLDITVQEDLSNINQELKDVPIDILINNAGVYFKKRDQGVDCIHYDNWRRTLEVNTLGAVRVTEALLENVEKSDGPGLVVALSSHMGSIADIDEPGSLYYRSSKAALNAAYQGLAVDLQEMGIGILLLHPGGVLTRMGPDHGIPERVSVSGMRHIVENFTLENTGSFVRYDGELMPW